MVAKEYCNYIHCRPNGEPFYVGKATIDKRHRTNRPFMFSHRNNLHKKIVAKYGKENIQVFVFPCSTEQEALDAEIQHIAQFRSEGLQLANLTDGGEGMSGFKLSEESKAKLSAIRKGRKPTEETRAKLSAARIGKPSPVKGRKHTDEAKANMSAFQKGRKKSEEHKAKIAAAHIGKKMGPHTEEWKVAASNRKRGRKLSPEHCAAIKAAWEKRKSAKENEFCNIV